MVDILNLKSIAKIEVYMFIDEYIKELPKSASGQINEFEDGFVDNDVDALRHAYVSGVYTMEYGSAVAEILGRMHELVFSDSSSSHPQSENMDLWNNSIGRKYGKVSKTREELFFNLKKALDSGELIITPNDKRKYTGDKYIKRKPKSFVIKIEERKSGMNVLFYDISQKEVMTKQEFLNRIKEKKYPNYTIKNVKGEEIPVSKKDRFKFNNLG